MLLTILLISAHLISFINASPFEIFSRDVFPLDPYMVCEDPPPLSSLPPNYLRAWYPTALDLCSASNGAARNVDCVCHAATGFIHCDETAADSVLYNYRVPATGFAYAPYQPLHHWCSNSCYCTDPRSARRSRENSRARSSSTAPIRSTTQTSAVGTSATNHVQSVVNVPYDPDGPNPFAQQAQSSSDPKETDMTWNPLWENKCGNNCTSNADCTAGGGDCMCLAAQKGTYQPGIGTVSFVAACIVSLAAGNANGGGSMNAKGIGGKRDVGVIGEELWDSCPCNASYVSRSCCGVSNGLVWEGQEFKLGELVR